MPRRLLMANVSSMTSTSGLPPASMNVLFCSVIGRCQSRRHSPIIGPGWGFDMQMSWRGGETR